MTPITLADVLSADELAAQAWQGSLVLNDSAWMRWSEPGQVFARMAVAEQRTYVLASLDLARMEGSHPTWCLRVLLEVMYGCPPSCRR